MLLHSQQGFSLVEVMVAAAIVSVSLLSVTHAQLIALHASDHAYLISLADLKNVELAENVTMCGPRPRCLQQALTLWEKDTQASFPRGLGRIVKRNVTGYQSKIQWFAPYSKSPSSLKLLFGV